MSLSQVFTESLVSKLIASALLITLVVVARTFVKHILVRYLAQSELRRRWIVNVRNALILLAVFGLASIWLAQLRTFAAALVGFAVAFAIATREFILCLNGSVLRTATNAYSVGDRIEIAGRRGDVIDFNLFTTTLLEVGPGQEFHLRTGRTVIVPNSRLLDTYLVNESFMEKYVLHVFSVPLQADQHWERAEQILLEAAEEECADFIDEVRRHMNGLERRLGLPGIPVNARTSVQMPEPGKLNLLVRVPSPVGRQDRIEQAVLRKFLQRFNQETAAREAPPPDSGEQENELDHPPPI